jgi:Uma2 family endonuclease
VFWRETLKLYLYVDSANMGALQKIVSSFEFLEMERSSKEKHELHRGHVVNMAGASLAHNEIVANLVGNIKFFLRGKLCRIYASDLRVQIPTVDSFTYPDASIVCGQPILLDSELDTITNPTVILEVMSKSTEQYDRGTKFFYYMQIPSLSEYILVDSSKLYIQAARKQNDGSWKFEEITDRNQLLAVKAIEHEISAAEIYENVKF